MHTPLFRWTNLATTVALVSALAACTASEDGDDGAATVGSSGSGDGSDPLAPEWNGGLTVQVMNEATAVVSWNAASDDTTAPEDLTYRIWWATESGGQELDLAPQASTQPGATSITLSGLRPSKEHFFVVRAVDADGLESTNSEEASGLQPDTTAPDFEGVEDATAIAGGRISVTWNEAVDNGAYGPELRYAVSISTESGVHDWTSPTMLTEPGVTSAEIDGLDELVEYYVSVRAIDTNGNTDNNVAERSVTTPDETPPSFDGATMAVGAGNAIQVQWNPGSDNVTPANELRYRVYVADMSGEQTFDVPHLTTAPGATSANVTGLPLSTEHFVVVRAVDDAGNEDDNTVEVTAFTGASSDETPPTFTGVLLAEPQSATAIRLAWDLATDDQSPPGSIVYDVYQSTTLGAYNFMAPVKTTGPGDAFTFVDGLQPETDYYFVVRARDVAGNQDTNVGEVGGQTFPDTTAPEFDGIANAQGLSATTVGVNWDPATDDVTPPSEIVYYVYAGAPGMIDWGSPIAVTPPGQTNYTVSGLFPEQDFEFGVRAVDEKLNVDTNTVTVLTSALQDTTPPTFAGAQTVGDISWNDGVVYWNSASDNVSSPQDIYYEVYVVESGEPINYNTPTATTPAGELKYGVTGLRPGYDYDVAVRAFDQFGNGESNTVVRTWTTTSDVTAPTFAGPTGFAAVAATSLTPQWNLATDNAWGAADITYSVCRATSANGCGFGGGSWTTFASGSNVTSLQLTGLTASTTYWVWVRATDGTGNTASPSNSVSTTTSSDMTPPTFSGATGTQAVGGCAGAASVVVTWNAGSDNSTPQGSLVYDIWYSNVSGAAAITKANGSPPDATSAAGATQATVTGLAANTTYYFVVRARDFAGLRDSNTVTVSRATAADICNPTAGNASSASMSDCNTLTVNYAAAVDNVSAASAHTYQACVSSSSTGCSLSWVTTASQVGGSSMNINVANPGTWYVWVRPVDQAGNVGGIGTNRSVNLTDATPPSVAAVTFTADMVESVARRIDLDWTEASDACWPANTITYQLCRTPNACTTTWVTGVNAGTGNSHNWTSLPADDTSYTFYLRATDGSGNISTLRSVTRSTAVSYDNQVLPLWTGFDYDGDCGGCHAWTIANTVNVNATCNMSYKRIVAGVKGTSLLYLQMSQASPPCSAASGVGPMPQVGPNLAQNNDMIGRWIDQGAFDN